MRGRNRPKGPNPLTRSYESNGPDVKIRGTAQHIADKYAQLARDAQASGDPVAAENYFQHGEHYFRIISGAQEQTRQQVGGYARGFDEADDDGEDEGQGAPQGYAASSYGANGYNEDYADPSQQPQPHAYEGRQDTRPDNGQDGNRPNRRDRFNNRNDRPQRFEGQRDGNRQDFNRQDSNRQESNRQDGGRQDYHRREESGRQDYQRLDNNRQDFNRQDSARNEAPRQDFGRPDYSRSENGRGDGQRQDTTRQEFPRQDLARQEQPRQDFGRPNPGRTEAPRYGNGRSDGPVSELAGGDAVRQDAPRPEPRPARTHDGAPRRSRRREEPESRGSAEEVAGLPAFLMTPPRPVAAERPPETAPEAETARAAPISDEAPAPKPRRRRRARFEGSDLAEGSEATASDAPPIVE